MSSQAQTLVPKKKLPLLMRLFAWYCLINGVLGIVKYLALAGIFAYAFIWDYNAVVQYIGGDTTLAAVALFALLGFSLVSDTCQTIFGASVLKNKRRNAARWADALIALSIVELLGTVTVNGITAALVQPSIQLVIFIVLSVVVDPTLVVERRAAREEEDAEELAAKEVGMLGRDLTGKGYLKLNFFNLFWTFVVCCVLGLVLEVIWHMVVVDPGVYQDRAGLLYGPFSPIYGFGALLMTIALNRLYDNNPILIFLASAVIGGLFEVAVSWFMQMGFGAVAWDYTGSTLFGLIPDPVALLFNGRTSTAFACIWGVLGLVWIKVFLPQLLKLINLIPWKMRYSLTVVCAALMLVDGIMTLQSLDCWYMRVSNKPIETPLEQFYATHYDNDYMAHRFQSMTITPENSSRVDPDVLGELS